MRVARVLAALVAAGVAGAVVAGCGTEVAGTGTLAEEAQATPSASGSASPTDDPSASPTTPTPTVDPTLAKERVTCVQVQASIRTTNNRFNDAKSRERQISVFSAGATSIERHLMASRLPRTDKIYVQGAAVLGEMRKVLTAARAGGSPSTDPYNRATARFSTACAAL
jgi:hypothetical protein